MNIIGSSLPNSIFSSDEINPQPLSPRSAGFKKCELDVLAKHCRALHGHCQGVRRLRSRCLQRFGKACNSVGGAFDSLFNGDPGGFVGGLGDAAGNVVSGVANAVGDAASAVGNAVSDFFSGW